jgi:dTDP-4-dehydrorhamnose 3,5-epimerase
VLRGLHYQLNPAAQGKLVRCVCGRIFDVAVDIRKRSPTFRKWKGVELSGDSGRMLYVPEGFAHGYCALAPDSVVIYKTTDYWSPEHERAIRWNDPGLAINWPVRSPIVSEKDNQAPDFDQAENNFE